MNFVERPLPPLALLKARVPLWDDEPAYALFNRLARRNGANSLVSLAGDFKIPYIDVANGRANGEVAALSGADLAALDATTFRWEDKTAPRIRLGNEELLTEDWSYRKLKICPACLRCDLERKLESNLGGLHEFLRNRWLAQLRDYLPHIRSWWNLTHITICPIHRTPLLETHPENPEDGIDYRTIDVRFAAGKRFDFLDAPAEPSIADVRAESYILGRLGFMPRMQRPFLDALPLWAAVRVMDRIGAVAANGPQSYSSFGGDTSQHDALAAGYVVLSQGEAGLFRLLDGLVASAPIERGKWGPRVVYGRIYDWLSHDTRDRIYDPLRELVRDHAINNIPLSRHELVMGRPVERRVFTLWHVSRELGTVPSTARRILRALGHLTPEDDETKDNWQIIFKEPVVQQLKSDLSDRLGFNETRDWLGLPRAPMERLYQAGILKPFLDISTGVAEHVFRKRDLEAFVASLSGAAPVVERREARLCDVVEAGKRSQTSTVEIVTALLDGRLACRGLLNSATGLMRILVSVDDATRMLAPRTTDPPGMTIEEARRRLGLTWNVIGKLIKHGHIAVIKGPAGYRNRKQMFIRESEIERFEREYVSAAVLADERGTHVRILVPALRREGIEPAIEKMVVAQYFYTRASIAASSTSRNTRANTRIDNCRMR